MAINTQKFLPSSKGGSISKVSSKVISSRGSSFEIGEKSFANINIIRVKVIEIDSILKGTLAIEKKQLDNKKKETSSKRREKIEEKLETKPKAEKGKIQMPKSPRMGFLDWVKNFIGNIILGYFAVRLVDHLPKIIPFVKFLGKATDFVLDIGGKLLDGLVTFIDWGYKAYDATRGFSKNLFGEDGAKQFDQLSGLLNKFLNLAIIAGLAAAGSGGFGSKGAKSGLRGGTARPRPGTGGRPRVTTSRGGFDIRNPLRLRPKVTIGRGGNRAILSSVRPFLKRIPLPVIGALIDFGLSWALGENPGRAAFRAIGAGILGTIGAGLAGAVGLAGGPLAIATAALGSIAGGTLGDMAGGALYDLFFGGKTTKSSTKKMAGGGITRGGKSLGKVRRSIGGKPKKRKYKRTLAPQKPGEVEATSPGADVGGKDKLFGLFPNPLQMMQKVTDVMNPFKVIERAGKNLGESDYFGPILAITSKILLGQKPTQNDYKNVGLGINMLLYKGINEGKLKGGLAVAFAEGGLVDPQSISAITDGGDISGWVAKAFKDATETNAQKTLREIQENLRLKQAGTEREDDRIKPDEPIDTEGGGYSTNAGDYKELLDLIASKESSSAGGYNAYNEGGASGGYQVVGYGGDSRKGPLRRALTDMTIKEIMAHQKNVNPPIHAAGRYQIIGSTLASLMRGGYGPTGVRMDDKFTPDVQDKLGIALIKYRLKTGATPENFINEWRGLKFANKEKLQSAINKAQKGRTYRIDVAGTGTSGMNKGGIGGSVVEYITGDPNTPFGRFDKAGHGTTDNYHDHIAFRNRDTAIKAFNFFKSKGVQVTEFKGYGPVGGHAAGSYHYSGLAFDVPGAQWGGSGAIGSREYSGSAKVRQILKQFLGGGNIAKFEKGGPTSDGPQVALVGERGREFVIDADSTKAIEENFPGFLGAINNAKYKDAINVLSNFAPYESEAPQTIFIPHPGTQQDSEYDSGSSGSFIPMGGEEESDPFATLYQGT
jgi:hypothetical protein